MKKKLLKIKKQLMYNYNLTKYIKKRSYSKMK